MPALNLRRPRAVAAAPALALALVMSPALAGSAVAASPVSLGAADSFAVLAGSTITNTGSTSISGDIGLCCTGIATTGFGPGADQVSQSGGAPYVGTGSVAATAQDDLDIAYAYAAGQAPTGTLPVDLSLSGTPADPLLPGVYESTAHGALQINTGLTLDFQGDPNAVFIFQGTDLRTAVGSSGSVRIVNGGSAPSACNIFWQLSDATQGVTLGTASAFKGTTMSLGASVLGTSATVEGRVLTRRSKAVNLDTNTITRPACAASAQNEGGTAPTDATPTPTPTPAPAPAPAPTTGTPPPATTGGTPAPPSPSLLAILASVPSPTSSTGSPGGSAAGAASLSGPSAPVSGPFDVVVTGNAIATVTFRIDGRHVTTVRSRPGRTRFKLTINPRRQSHNVHHVTARVRFKRASRTRMTTRRFVYRRVTTGPQTPRFTG
jgi:hypothetical protein